MPHRRKPAKPASIRLKAHRIPPTVLTRTAKATGEAPLAVLSPSSSGVVPALSPASRARTSRVATAATALSPGWIWAAVAAAALLLLLVLTALNPFGQPQTTEAGASAAAGQTPGSTPVALWKKGAVPRLYSADDQWGSEAYGASTLGLSGAAPTAVAMVYVYETGATDVTPASVATWANEHNVASTSPDAINTVLTEGASTLGLSVDSIEPSNIAIRQALAQGRPVVAVLAQGTTGPVESAVVICAIDQDRRLVVNDPTSVENTARTWSFDEVVDSAKELYAYALA